MAAEPHILLVLSDQDASMMIERNILGPEGYRVSSTETCAKGESLIRSTHPDLMILGDDLEDGNFLEFAETMAAVQPTLSIILFTKEISETLPVEVLRLGLVDWLTPPLHPDDVLRAVQSGLERSRNWEQWLRLETRRQTGALQQRVSELETLASVGQAVTAELDLDRVLMVVVEAAVTFAGAQEGSILLIDDDSGELYMRAARNFQDEFVRTFRLPVHDTLAGGVLRSGEPILINPKTPRKILTSYLVYALIYVPLKVHGRVIGVLGVDHRSQGHEFDQSDLAFLSALSDYAAIAIENAQLYANTELERKKLETILTQIDDGVIVLDQEETIVLVNQAVRKAFGLGDEDVSGQTLDQTFQHKDLINAVRGQIVNPFLHEIESEGGRIYNAQTAEIPGVGRVAILHDITYLKELDRIKSDFVNAVSHDLRSPLTAILGYVELIDRVGEVNEQQAEFIRRAQLSVHNITDLINDLLDLGRVEVGLSANMENVVLSPIINNIVIDIQNQLDKKTQNLTIEIANESPIVVGDPTQLRQMLNNLLSNASKYTPEGGDIKFVVMEEKDLCILQVIDTGIGIPTKDQIHIFDRFYRADNAPEDVQGTGLGLAIVKTIVDNHRGRIWVDSIIGKGSTFTVMLPMAPRSA